MGYQIAYELDKINVTHKRINSGSFSAAVLVIVLVMGSIAAQFGSVVVQSLCLGGKNGIHSAAERLVDDLHEGVGVTDAFETFCMELVQ